MSEGKGTGSGWADWIHRTKARDLASQALVPNWQGTYTCLWLSSWMPHLGGSAGWTRSGAGSCWTDVRKPWCPSHYLLIPPFCFHLLCFLLNSLPRLKVSISGLGPKVKFFGNFQWSSFSCCWVQEGGWGTWSEFCLFLMLQMQAQLRPLGCLGSQLEWWSKVMQWKQLGVRRATAVGF